MGSYDKKNNKNDKGFRKEGRPRLPEGYLVNGYFKQIDDRQVLNEAYIIEYPKQIVELLKKNRNENKNSQIRKYYSYCKSLNDNFKKHEKNSEKKFEYIEGDFARIIPMANDARTRGKVSWLFVEFMEKNFKVIHNAANKEAAFDAFMKHFEAVMAYLPRENS